MLDINTRKDVRVFVGGFMTNAKDTSLAGLGVLVVDDETLLRRGLVADLEALGADV